MKRFIILGIFAASWQTPALAQVFVGPAIAVDGDTIDMTGTRIRLRGIDAPELSQLCERDGEAWECGREAKSSLAEIVKDETLECNASGIDEHNRVLATCQTSIFDAGQEMVRRGMALASDDAPSNYAPAAQIAQDLKFGMWAGEFQKPADWRAANPDKLEPLPPKPAVAQTVLAPVSRIPAEQRFANSTGCAIKGNRNRRGEWIYHLPGQNYYDVTRPEELFCTESDARAAGYRRSKE